MLNLQHTHTSDKLLIPTFVGEELILLISASFDASDNKARPHLLMRSTVLRATASLTDLVALGGSQLSQSDKGLTPSPGARAKVKILKAKKKQNSGESQLDHEFKLIE